MNAPKRGLGRGLDALLGARESGEALEGRLRQVPIELVSPSSTQPRRHFDANELDALADSIRQQGLLEPVLLRPASGGGYELIAGERRWRAAQKAGMTRIPALVREATNQQTQAMALVENMQRVDLRPLEMADGLHRLIREHEMTQQSLAEAVGLSRAKVANLLRLLSLESEVKALLDEGRIEEGHAKVLLGLSGGKQAEAAREVVARQLSVRQTEVLLNRFRQAEGAKTEADRHKDPDTEILERELAEELGTRVSLAQGAKGKGRLVIHYSSLEVLDGVLRRLKRQRAP